MKKVSGVIFDMDGLVFDTESVYSRQNIETSKKYNMTGYDADYYLSEVGLGEAAVYQKYLKDFKHVGQEDIDAFFEDSREAIWKEFNEQGAPLKPGIMELLTYLNDHDIPCVICSSSKRVAIDLLLEKANMTHLFKGIVSGDDVEHAKPNPEIVEKAVEMLGTKKDETVMLEDSLNGIRASYCAGVPVIMVPDLIAPDAEVEEKAFSVYPDLFSVLDFVKSV